MKRIWLAWTVFGLCAGAMLIIMGWGSKKLLELDAREYKARQEAALEENVRLSLWRMETALAPIIVQENSRPYTAYFSIEQQRIDSGSASSDSPASPTSSYVKLHFQLDQNGRLALSSGEGLHRTNSNLPKVIEDLGNPAALSTLRAAIPKAWTHVEQSIGPNVPLVIAAKEEKPPLKSTLSTRAMIDNGQAVADASKASTQIVQQAEPVQPAEAQQHIASQSPAMQSQMARNYQEFEARGMLNTSNAFVPTQKSVPRLAPHAQPLEQSKTSASNGRTVEIRTGVLAPLWVGDELIFARHVRVGSREVVQGCWLDWPKVRASLLASIHDLLPGSDLIPERGQFDPAEGRTLTSLPLRLVPGQMRAAVAEEISPMLFSLKIAWACMLLAIVSVGLLLMGAISLSQRRAAFVSSVTHELRTPLTTFRMYTEMLVDGMAADPAKQREYHQTLYRESDRLVHLVENVLSYARLERGRYGDKEEISIGELIHRIRARLEEHAGFVGMQLLVNIGEHTGEKIVRVDASAIERILFNLVDNACKYARSAKDRRIHLHANCEGRWVRITVEDHGPGIERRRTRRLFKAFRNSANQAARSAEGVGIGLPLSRRLASAAGGRLVVIDSNEGACVRLDLPLAVPQKLTGC